MARRFWTGFWALLLLAAVAAGCGRAESAGGSSGKIKVAATTGMVADLAKIIGGERVEVTALMGPGVDPHLYKASEGDIARLANAQIIFYNGLHLEGRMGEILAKMAKEKPTVAVAERIAEATLLKTADGAVDPHIWFDVSLWMQAAEMVRESLIQLDPDGRSFYEANAAAYLKELGELHAYAREQIGSVPAQSRVLVTAHDAFGYFGRAYGIEVMGLQGISTAAEYGLADVQRLVDLLVQRQIKAVFVESSVPKRSIEALVQGAGAKGHAVAVGGELFSDAMGPAGSPTGSYVGMVRHNVDTITGALK